MKPAEEAAISWRSTPFTGLTQIELYRVLQLRQQVFILEQQCFYADLDDLDQSSHHIGAWREGTLLAYLRCLPPGLSYSESALGRIVVSPAARGLSLGRELVGRGIEYNLVTWPGKGIRIGAQEYLEAFYNELGFTRDSDTYDEDGIPHIKMLYGDSQGH
jgi:ElaA protein